MSPISDAIVVLVAAATSAGDKTKTYPAGTAFRFRRIVRDLPDLAEVRADLDHGARVKARPRHLTPVAPMVEVTAMTPDRSRLLFRPADLARAG
jgi:hypothetical protein